MKKFITTIIVSAFIIGCQDSKHVQVAPSIAPSISSPLYGSTNFDGPIIIRTESTKYLDSSVEKLREEIEKNLVFTDDSSNPIPFKLIRYDGGRKDFEVVPSIEIEEGSYYLEYNDKGYSSSFFTVSKNQKPKILGIELNQPPKGKSLNSVKIISSEIIKINENDISIYINDKLISHYIESSKTESNSYHVIYFETDDMKSNLKIEVSNRVKSSISGLNYDLSEKNISGIKKTDILEKSQIIYID